ncbi:hypothetical protein C2845_PM05G08860 [Panicum miliaceum]|uniref:Uncharacterized protein n=1 Tax=Panicum miliaceum TaxID=4540 RepID=A0A3L6SSW2_PANMI|nr:hypothetical protein C2845_PM05G08860 [Panicum miliaceum]
MGAPPQPPMGWPPPTGYMLMPMQPQPSEEERKEAAKEFRADRGKELEGIIPQATLDSEAELKKQAREFDADFAKVETKIHRLPPSLQSQDPRYFVPMAVAIGPYHWRLPHLQKMGMVKNVAAYHFSTGIFRSCQEMYEAFRSAIGDVDVRSLYVLTDDAVAGMRDDDEFMSMMLVDGCFLLQYMLKCTGSHGNMPPSLVSFFDSNQGVIDNDIMLLENQLPWVVIQALMKFKEVPVEKFIAKMGRTLQVARKEKEGDSFVLDGSYTPPHLLGLLRFYKTGRNIAVPPNNQDKSFSLINCCCYNNSGVPPAVGLRPMSKTVSAIELAEIGIKLTASRTTKFMDMGFKKKLFSSEISLAPLLLDEIRSCWLLNLAAFELCTGTTSGNETENQAVCSYLAVLAMLMDREEDVHKLRSKRLVQGELTNKETLDFFKSLIKRISGGPLYIHIMEEIEDYKLKRWVWIKVHAFVYNNYRTIAAVLSIVGVLVGIFKTLFSLKQLWLLDHCSNHG